MKLDAKQLTDLIQLTSTARGEDRLCCNGCFELMDQLAQAELLNLLKRKGASPPVPARIWRFFTGQLALFRFK